MIERLPLSVIDAAIGFLDVVGDVAIGNENIFEPIAVEIKELATEAEEFHADRGDAGGIASVSEEAISIVVVEEIALFGEVGYE